MSRCNLYTSYVKEETFHYKVGTVLLFLDYIEYTNHKTVVVKRFLVDNKIVMDSDHTLHHPEKYFEPII